MALTKLLNESILYKQCNENLIGTMEEITLFWSWGKLKSVTYLRNGVPLDRLVYDEDGNYKDFESINPIEDTNEK